MAHFRQLLDQQQIWDHRICGMHNNTIQALQNKDYETVIANLRSAVPAPYKINVIIGTVIKPIYTCQEQEPTPDAIIYLMLELTTWVDCKMMTFVRKTNPHADAIYKSLYRLDASKVN